MSKDRAPGDWVFPELNPVTPKASPGFVWTGTEDATSDSPTSDALRRWCASQLGNATDDQLGLVAAVLVSRASFRTPEPGALRPAPHSLVHRSVEQAAVSQIQAVLDSKVTSRDEVRFTLSEDDLDDLGY